MSSTIFKINQMLLQVFHENNFKLFSNESHIIAIIHNNTTLTFGLFDQKIWITAPYYNFITKEWQKSPPQIATIDSIQNAYKQIQTGRLIQEIK